MQEFSVKVDPWYVQEVYSSSFKFLHTEVSLPVLMLLSYMVKLHMSVKDLLSEFKFIEHRIFYCRFLASFCAAANFRK